MQLKFVVKDVIKRGREAEEVTLEAPLDQGPGLQAMPGYTTIVLLVDLGDTGMGPYAPGETVIFKQV